MNPIGRCAILVLFVLSSGAHAEIVRWTLHDIVFEDGGAASGYFDVDSETGELALRLPADPFNERYDGFRIVTTPGTLVPESWGYVPEISIGTGDQWFYTRDWGVFMLMERASLGSRLQIQIAEGWRHSTTGSFAVRGGPIPVDCAIGRDEHCAGQQQFGWDDPGFATRGILPGGYVTATVIPEPATPTLLLVALGALLARRKLRAVWRAPGAGIGHA